uniref:Uncharacterized protein n=1 Tax=Anopheles minimus TaxID=112268 RepID=A0A182W834_9DIPT
MLKFIKCASVLKHCCYFLLVSVIMRVKAEAPINSYLPPAHGHGHGGEGGHHDDHHTDLVPPSSSYGTPDSSYGPPHHQSGFHPDHHEYEDHHDHHDNHDDSGSFEDEPAKYEFSYEVDDEDVDLSFGHEEMRDGDFTTGKYNVLLPDGRRQSMRQITKGIDRRLPTKEEMNIHITMIILMSTDTSTDMMVTQRKLHTLSLAILGNHITILNITALGTVRTNTIRMGTIMDTAELITEYTTVIEAMIAMHTRTMVTDMAMDTGMDITDTMDITGITVITTTGIMDTIVEEAAILTTTNILRITITTTIIATMGTTKSMGP